MTLSVLLDTSFLITLVDRNRPNHCVATQYYQYLLESETPMYLSAIVASEFEIKQPVTSLPLENFRTLPFNITDAILAAHYWNILAQSRDENTRRHVARDDVKLIAQASRENISHLFTEDKSSLYKYCERLRKSKDCSVQAIILADGFSYNALHTDGQQGLDFDTPASGS